MLLAVALVSSCGDSGLSRVKRQVREVKQDSVELLLGSTGYQAIRHQLGVATITLRDVKANPEGGIVILDIGNLISADITGFKMTLSYGKDGVERPFSFSVNETLMAGRNTRVRLVMKGADAKDLKNYLRVSDFQPTGVSLMSAT